MHSTNAYIWGLINRFAPVGIQVISNMILARFLCPADFGTIGVLNIFMAIASALIDSGLGGSLIKEKTVSKIDCQTIATFNLVSSCLLYLLICLGADSIESFYGIADLSIITKLISLTFIINAIGIVPKAIMAKDLKFKELCNIAIVSVLIGSLISIILAVNGWGIYSLVVYPIINSIVNTLISMFVCHYRFSIGFSMQSFKKLVPFGIYTSFTTIVDTAYENLLTSLTGKYLSVIQAGYLTQAKKIEEGLTTSVASAIGNVSFPILTQLKDEINVFKKEANSLLLNLSALCFPILLIISIYSEQICTLLFGANWRDSGSYLSVLILAGIFLIQETLIRSFIKSLCAVKSLFKLTLYKRTICIAVIIISLIVNPVWILYGYVLSTFIGLIFNMILYTRLVHENFFVQILKVESALIPALLLCFMALVVKKIIYDEVLALVVNGVLICIYYIIFLIVIRKR